jgi:hypothetical protein
MRDCPAAPQMTKPERIVTVHQYASIFRTIFHQFCPSKLMADAYWHPLPNCEN